MTKKLHKNLTAYKDVEKMSNYRSNKELNKYRKYLFQKEIVKKNFIKKYVQKETD